MVRTRLNPRPCDASRPSKASGAALSLVALTLLGCVTSGNIVDDRGEGETRCYIAPYDLLWPAADEAIRHLGFVIERANRENGVLVGRTYEPEVVPPEDMALDSNAGERVAVFFDRDSVDREGNDVWAVEVVSRAIFAFDPSSRDWTRAVFGELEARLPPDQFEPSEDVAACSRVHSEPF